MRDSLFLPEDEVAARVLPLRTMQNNLPEWQGIAVVLEREGLPKIDPVMGGRYWPAVRAFFDARAGVGKAPLGVDGKETW